MADAEVVIVGSDGTEHVFPPGFDPKRAAAIVSGQTPQSSVGGLVMSAANAAMPAATTALEEFATSPTAAKVGGKIANNAVAAANAIRGVATMNPEAILAAPQAGYYAGRGGYWGTKALQKLAGSAANAANAAAPYVKGALTTAAAAQSVLDLAQIADPKRKDIGFLGMSVNDPRSDTDKKAHPALINAMADAFMRSVKKSPQMWADVMSEIQKRTK